MILDGNLHIDTITAKARNEKDCIPHIGSANDGICQRGVGPVLNKTDNTSGKCAEEGNSFYIWD